MKGISKLLLAALALVHVGVYQVYASDPVEWDFTSWSQATIDNLNSDENWSYNSAGYWDYGVTASGSNVTLQANSVEISELSGLTFNYPTGGSRIRVDNRSKNKALFFKSNQERLNITLEAGKKVTINIKGNKETRMFSHDSLVVAYNQTSADINNRNDVFIASSYLSAATSISFGGESSGASFNIFSITVEDATPEELNEANRLAYLKLLSYSSKSFGSDDVVTQPTLWTFDQYMGGEIISDGGIVNYNGLYLRGHETNKMTINKLTGQSTFEFNEKNVTIFSVLRSATGREASGTKASSINTALCSFNAAVPGTTYVYARVENTERKFNISFNGTKVVDSDIADGSAYNVYSYVSTEPGCVVISGTGAYMIAAIKFVPTLPTPIVQTKEITMSRMGVMSFSDVHAWSLPAGLTAYTVTKSTIGNKISATPIPSIPACTGVLLKGEHSQTYVLTMTDTTTTSRNISYSLRPVVVDYNLSQTYSVGDNDKNKWDNFILAREGDDVILALSSGSGILDAGKAYFSIRRDQSEYNPESSSRMLHLYFDNDPTPVNGVVAWPDCQRYYYNLNGQRLEGPVRGLCVVNGKKVIIK